MAKLSQHSKKSTTAKPKTNSLLSRVNQKPYKAIAFVAGFIVVGLAITRIFAAAPAASLCKADTICVKPGADLCSTILNVKSGQTIVVQGDSTKPYKIGACTLSSNGNLAIADIPKNVTLTADNNSRPVIDGNLALYNADRWLVQGLTFTSSTQIDRLLGFIGGDGWRVTNNEFIGGGGYTQLQVGHSPNYSFPVNFTIDHNFLHDNSGNSSHQDVQDHLLYVISGVNRNANATINDNYFIGCLGPSVKLGSTNPGDGDGSSGIKFIRNTLVNKTRSGYSMVVATRSTNIQVENNNFYGTDNTNNPDSIVIFELGAFEGNSISLKDNNFYGYDNSKAKNTPLYYTNANKSFGGIFYKSANPILNQSISVMSQSGNVNHNPGYAEYNGKALDCSKYPPLTKNGVTYGAAPCSKTNAGGISISNPPSSNPVSSNPITSVKPPTTSPVVSNVPPATIPPTTVPVPPTVSPQPPTTNKAPTGPTTLNKSLKYDYLKGKYNVVLTWPAATGTATSYEVRKNNIVVGRTSPTIRKFVDYNIKSSSLYFYQVFALNGSYRSQGTSLSPSIIVCYWVMCGLQ